MTFTTIQRNHSRVVQEAAPGRPGLRAPWSVVSSLSWLFLFLRHLLQLAVSAVVEGFGEYHGDGLPVSQPRSEPSLSVLLSALEPVFGVSRSPMPRPTATAKAG